MTWKIDDFLSEMYFYIFFFLYKIQIKQSVPILVNDLNSVLSL